MKKLIFLLPLVFLLFSLSCSGGSGSGGSSGSFTVSGTWSGQWTSTKSAGEGGAINANLQLSGNQISGSATITNTELGNITGNISGTISNSGGPGTLNFGVISGQGESSTFSGTYDNNRISGTYTASNGDSGTFVLTR